jgi:hypothetical protein
MKRTPFIVGLLVLAAQIPLWGYDTSPSSEQVVPEAIWAAASGSGTWVTEIQITSCSQATTDIYVAFCCGDIRELTLHEDLAPYHSLRYSNILAQLQTLDPAFTYYGRVGALWFYCSGGGLLQVQAKTVNGDFGKTFPGLNVVAGNSAASGRPVIIQDIVRSSAYRTSVGVFNSNDSEFTADFWIIDAAGETVGSSFSKTIPAYGFLSFNPFTQAGITSGTYENCLLYVEVSSGASDIYGLMLYGSLANNYSNDTCALLAKQYGSAASPLPPPFKR